MTQIKFDGPAVISGFPANEAFSFEVNGSAFILKAGKNVFLRVEKESLLSTAQYEFKEVAAKSVDTVDGPVDFGATLRSALQKSDNAPQTASAPADEPKERKPRSPNFSPDPQAKIIIDTTRVISYRKLRASWYETLKTANGRTVEWWANTSMVKNLEGSPNSMLKFFIDDGSVRLDTPVHTAGHGMQQAIQAEVIGGAPQHTLTSALAEWQQNLMNSQMNEVRQQAAIAPQPPQAPGALWTPPNTAPPSGDGPKFL